VSLCAGCLPASFTIVANSKIDELVESQV